MNTIWMPTRFVSEKDEFTIKDYIIGGNEITDVKCFLYLGSTDKTSSTMLLSTLSFSGHSYETNMISNLKGGNIYVLACRVYIDGFIKTRKCEIRVQKDGDLY